MGFGILFVGYFLTMNFAYSYFTDAIAAAVMLYALYKLAYLNTGFKRAMRVSVGFLIFGIFELVLSLLSTMMPWLDVSAILTARAVLRHLITFALTFFILDGIKAVALEVELPYLAKRCVRNIYMTLTACVLSVVLEAAGLAGFVDGRVLASLYFISLVLTVTVICMNLVQIYGAHMRIYLPENEKAEDAPSKFGFINDFRRHEEEKSREYAEYKLQKMKDKKDKKRKK